MWPLGVLNKDNLSLVLDANFNAGNATDATGRHSAIVGSGVTFSSGNAVLSAGNTGLAYADNLQDFACAGNWKIEGRFAVPTISGSYFFSLCSYPSYNSSDLTVYMTSDSTPRLSVAFGQAGVSSLVVDTSVITINANTFYILRLEKANNTFYLYVDNVLVGQKQDAAFATMNKTGKLLQLFGQATSYTNVGTCDYIKVWD